MNVCCVLRICGGSVVDCDAHAHCTLQTAHSVTQSGPSMNIPKNFHGQKVIFRQFSKHRQLFKEQLLLKVFKNRFFVENLSKKFNRVHSITHDASQIKSKWKQKMHP